MDNLLGRGMEIACAFQSAGDQLKENMVTMKRKLQDLEMKKADVEEELKNLEYSISRKKPRREVQNWLAEVDRIKAQVQEKEQEVQERRSWHRNPQLLKSVDKLNTELAELIEQSRFPRGLTLESCEGEGVTFPIKRLIGEKFQKNKSVIWDCLMGEEDSVIGIYGMGGVGKTTLLTHIHNQLLEHSIKVFWVTVSQNFGIQKLQRGIAESLDLDLSSEHDIRKRAARLASALNQRSNFILILDDVWEPIPLDEVGIRVGNNRSKLVLTTRSLAVCRQMSCQKKITVKPLSHQESWVLFMEILGNGTSLSPQIEETAKALVEECGGLPLGIITMAGSMKGVEDTREWRHALEEIKDVKHDDMDWVFGVLKHSYCKLNKTPELQERSKLQECFLYCSLFPEDKWIPRDELIQLLIDENLIDETKSRKSQFDEGHVMLNRLENVCLLERGKCRGEYEAVKMHDLVRDMAIKVTSVGPHRFLVKAGMKLSKMPNEEEWSEDLFRVSLIGNYIESIPLHLSPPKCPKLSTLFLCENQTLEVIPGLFFVHMSSLNVLDLSHTNIKILPSSITNLESLTSLSLACCFSLTSVPSLEKLTGLRRLNLESTEIEEVPKNLEKLINLRYLNLYNCPNLRMIPVGILPKLSHIEFFQSDWRVTLKGEEIGSWKRLENFYGRFDRISDFNSCIKSWGERTPMEYTILVGAEAEVGFCGEWNDYRRRVTLKELVVGAEDRLVLPRGLQLLEFGDCNGITSLSCSIATSEKVPDLWEWQVHRCNVLFFEGLEKPYLSRCPALTDLIERERSPSSSSALSSSVLPTNTFSFLRDLEIWGCHGLKRLFTPTQFSLLQSLESFYVGHCGQLVEIIGQASDEEDVNEEATTTEIISMPPRFCFLGLRFLPELKSICNSSIKLSESLEGISVTNCQNLTRITLLWEESHPLPSLHEFCVDSDFWDLEWKHPETKDALRHEFDLEHCCCRYCDPQQFEQYSST